MSKEQITTAKAMSESDDQTLTKLAGEDGKCPSPYYGGIQVNTSVMPHVVSLLTLN